MCLLWNAKSPQYYLSLHWIQLSPEIEKCVLRVVFFTFGRFSSVLLYLHVFLLIRITFGGHGKFTLQQLVANYWQIYASCCWVGIPVLRCGSGAESRFLPINVAASHSDLKSVAEASGMRDRRLLVTINNMLSSSSILQAQFVSRSWPRCML